MQMSNKALFRAALKAVFASSLGSFNSETSGNVLDKFSVDLGVLDVSLITNVNY